MAQQKEMDASKQKDVAKEGMRAGRDPVIMAAVGSVILSWYQFYVRGNKQHGLFIGLWPPTLLAFSNAVHIREIGRKVESKAGNLLDRLTQSR